MERNRDRGNLKWTSLMLPEHVEKLREWRLQDGKTARPELSSWDLQLMQETLETAVKRRCQVVLKTWRDGQVNYYQGTVEVLDLQTSVLVLRDPFGMEAIQAAAIIDVQFADHADGV